MPPATDFSILIITATYVALLLLVGYVVLCAATVTQASESRFQSAHWAELLGFSFAAGSGAVSLFLFLQSLAGTAPSRTSLTAVAVTAIVFIIFLGRQKQLLAPTVPSPRQRFDPLFFLGVAAAVTVIIAAFNVQARAGWAGLGDIDAFAIWMFKAKWVATAPLHPMPPAFHDPGLSYSHQDYPLGFPFLIAGICALGSRVSEELAKSLLLPQYLALVTVVYSTLRQFHRRAIAVTVTAIFAAAPVLTKNAGLVVAETPLLLAYAATLGMLLRWMRSGQRGQLILAAGFVATAAFTKNEGLALLPVIGLAALAFCFNRYPIGTSDEAPSRKKRLIDWCIAAVVCLACITPWLIFRTFLPRTHEDYGGKLRSLNTITENLPRLAAIIPFLFSQMFNPQNAGLIWFVLAIAAIVGWRAFHQAPTRILWGILIVQLSLYTATFIVTPWSLPVLLGMITPKLLVQTTPAATLLIGLHLHAAPRTTKPSKADE